MPCLTPYDRRMRELEATSPRILSQPQNFRCLTFSSTHTYMNSPTNKITLVNPMDDDVDHLDLNFPESAGKSGNYYRRVMRFRIPKDKLIVYWNGKTSKKYELVCQVDPVYVKYLYRNDEGKHEVVTHPDYPGADQKWIAQAYLKDPTFLETGVFVLGESSTPSNLEALLNEMTKHGAKVVTVGNGGAGDVEALCAATSIGLDPRKLYDYWMELDKLRQIREQKASISYVGMHAEDLFEFDLDVSVPPHTPYITPRGLHVVVRLPQPKQVDAGVSTSQPESVVDDKENKAVVSTNIAPLEQEQEQDDNAFVKPASYKRESLFDKEDSKSIVIRLPKSKQVSVEVPTSEPESVANEDKENKAVVTTNITPLESKQNGESPTELVTAMEKKRAFFAEKLGKLPPFNDQKDEAGPAVVAVKPVEIKKSEKEGELLKSKKTSTDRSSRSRRSFSTTSGSSDKENKQTEKKKDKRRRYRHNVRRREKEEKASARSQREQSQSPISEKKEDLKKEEETPKEQGTQKNENNTKETGEVKPVDSEKTTPEKKKPKVDIVYSVSKIAPATPQKVTGAVKGILKPPSPPFKEYPPDEDKKKEDKTGEGEPADGEPSEEKPSGDVALNEKATEPEEVQEQKEEERKEEEEPIAESPKTTEGKKTVRFAEESSRFSENRKYRGSKAVNRKVKREIVPLGGSPRPGIRGWRHQLYAETGLDPPLTKQELESLERHKANDLLGRMDVAGWELWETEDEFFQRLEEKGRWYTIEWILSGVRYGWDKDPVRVEEEEEEGEKEEKEEEEEEEKEEERGEEKVEEEGPLHLPPSQSAPAPPMSWAQVAARAIPVAQGRLGAPAPLPPVKRLMTTLSRRSSGGGGGGRGE
ncbi:hypothetical protein H072_8086 [Dactylellina haptotyla CBS 200.50]|uniref:Uncharacterized protein n=1 Tax=Dactylellina haptotyla (strain CBS 200.50) TaxID=1284197 RepID=S8BGB6_DACHA|nr:hypothetical protein H072_8086 [Dactylellina haptotyla CBS 200.50]